VAKLELDHNIIDTEQTQRYMNKIIMFKLFI